MFRGQDPQGARLARGSDPGRGRRAGRERSERQRKPAPRSRCARVWAREMRPASAPEGGGEQRTAAPQASGWRPTVPGRLRGPRCHLGTSAPPMPLSGARSLSCKYLCGFLLQRGGGFCPLGGKETGETRRPRSDSPEVCRCRLRCPASPLSSTRCELPTARRSGTGSRKPGCGLPRSMREPQGMRGRFPRC